MIRQPTPQKIDTFSGRSQIAAQNHPTPHGDLRSPAKRRGAKMRWPTSAFTLIEMVVSLSVISIVFLAMGSVMLLASKAIPSSTDAATLTYEANDAIQVLVSELQTATEIASVTDKSIAFKVPDRDNDGVDENLAYYWAGTAGDPLIRIYNAGTQVQAMPSVTEFGLSYDSQDGGQQPSGKMLSVAITLNPGQGPSSRVQTRITLLNQPDAP